MHEAPEWSGDLEGGDIVGYFPGDPDTSAGGIHQKAQELLGIETGNYGEDFSFRDRIPEAAIEGGRHSPTAKYPGAESIEPGVDIQDYFEEDKEDIDYIFVDTGRIEGRDIHNIQIDDHEVHFRTYKFSPHGNDGKIQKFYERGKDHLLSADFQSDVGGYRVTRLTENEDIPKELMSETQTALHRISETLPEFPMINKLRSATKTEWSYRIESVIHNSERIEPEEITETLNNTHETLDNTHETLDNKQEEVTTALARRVGEAQRPTLEDVVETFSKK